MRNRIVMSLLAVWLAFAAPAFARGGGGHSGGHSSSSHSSSGHSYHSSSSRRFSSGSVSVHGYFNSHGTYVSGYHRTRPDHTQLNNYSAKGNVNPYTGQKGTKTPTH